MHPLDLGALVEGTSHSICTKHLSSDLSRSAMDNIGLSTCGGNSGTPVNRSDSCNQLVGRMFIRRSYIFDYWSNVLRF